MLALAAWLASSSHMDRAEGTVPVVYLYLIFGSVILADIVGHAASLPLGYWLVERNDQGHGSSRQRCSVLVCRLFSRRSKVFA